MIEADDVERAAARHRKAFLRHLDDAFRRFGASHGLPERLREAVRATPRHRFVHRFRCGTDGPLLDFDDDPISLLPLVYHGEPLTHVDADGAPLPSTNSETAYILWLVSRLGVEPGQRVLEIGSGSGWLLAILAHLAGSDGTATGVEIILSLAAQAQTDMAAIGRTNAHVIAADATSEAIPGGPFDRVMITAATWDLPNALFSLVADGGHLLAPLRLPRDEGCEVALLRRDGSCFSALWKSPGWFVPLVGAGQREEVRRVCLDDLSSFCTRGDGKPSFSYPLWFGSLVEDQRGPAMMAFRRFLSFTEPNFAVFELDDAASPRRRWLSDFGLNDPDAGSAAIVRAGVLIGYGATIAGKRLLRAYRRWCELGMPGPAAYALEVRPVAHAAVTEEHALTELRGDSALIRRIDPRAGAWRSIFDDR